MSYRRKIISAVIASVAVTAGSILGTAPASAAPCTYAACNGLDPETTGCANDAVTKLDLLTTYNLYLAELRWSPTCHAFWTRIRRNQSEGGDGAYAYIAGGVYDANGSPVTKLVYTSVPDGQAWTKMISQAYPWERFCAFAAGYDSGCKITTL
ncbi:YjfA family protein [Kribbella sp. NBC_00709]|uniref:DUF2690 domain-containing protein n=1 Tax=Kribbella sp. NBC_00709 TaxID=2975972 RepID=UPI002E2D5878|nr:DUF2690 domain-containing protein [Kribbella sp. NBC_00709]